MRFTLPQSCHQDLNPSITGLVFDIQRCSLQDGPGIRTTVFLKGCPLHCLWCHNPESTRPRPQLWFDASKCVGCFHCLDVCESGAHYRDAGQHELDYELCTACGKCVDSCAGDAVKIIGQTMSTDQVMSVVLRDRDYYNQSGGGLTVSGGEPTAQFEFTFALLQASKKAGIHTCVETSGAVSWRKLEALARYTDLFLYDYKISDPKLHRKMVGCSNGMILQNLDKLVGLGARVVLRCPLIPSINDDDAHLQTIADLAAKYPHLASVEVMPYHNFGVGKGEKVGAIDYLPPIQPPAKATQDGWIARLHEFGCAAAKIG